MKAAGLVMTLICLTGCRPEAPKIDKPPTPVRTAAIQRMTMESSLKYSASLLPYRQVNIAFRVGGYVQTVHQVKGADARVRNVDIGDLVPAGTVLGQIREKDYDLQLAQASGQASAAHENENAAKAQLAQAEAGAAKAALDFERARALLESRAITKPEFDAAQAQYNATRAQVEAAKAQIQAVGGQVRSANALSGTAALARQDTAVVAPFTGVLVQRSVDVGSLVAPGTPAFVLADISSVKVSFGVPDTAVVRLRTGARLPMYTEAIPDRQFTGIVTAVAAVADPNTRLFQVEETLANPGYLLKPGMIGTVVLGGTGAKAEPVTVAPLSAIVRGKDAGYSFGVVVVQGNVARIRPVALGQTYGDHIGVSGVAAGDQVVTTGASMLVDGERVEVIR